MVMGILRRVRGSGMLSELISFDEGGCFSFIHSFLFGFSYEDGSYLGLLYILIGVFTSFVDAILWSYIYLYLYFLPFSFVDREIKSRGHLVSFVNADMGLYYLYCTLVLDGL